MYLEELGKKAKNAKYEIGLLSTEVKNDILLKVADALEEDADKLLAANKLDTDAGIKANMHAGLLDRLSLTNERI